MEGNGRREMDWIGPPPVTAGAVAPQPTPGTAGTGLFQVSGRSRLPVAGAASTRYRLSTGAVMQGEGGEGSPPGSSGDLEIWFRHQAMCLLCIAGLGGLPQISLPLGLSLVGPRDSDAALLDLEQRVTAST